MKYRKISSELIFTGSEFLDDENALVVSEEGEIVDLLPLDDAGIDVEHYQGLLMPGFVNCHCHLELSHMKGLIPRNTGLVEFVIQVMTKRSADPEAISSAITAAELEMQQGGIIAVGDICNTEVTVNHKRSSNLFYYNFIEATGFLNHNADERFAIAKKLFDSFSLSGNPTHLHSIVPHAPYSVSQNLFRLIEQFSSARVVTMHNQESSAENDLYRDGSGGFLKLYQLLGIDASGFTPTGKSSLRSIIPFLSEAGKTILVHNTNSSLQDIACVDPGRTYWCLCPKANLYIEGTLPPEILVLDERNTIVIGTDSLASNDTLSILEELKTLKSYFPTVRMQRLLTAATFAGARALGIDSYVGSFAKGKKPGVILLQGATRESFDTNGRIRRII